MDHVAPVETGHARQDLPGESDHILLREGLVVVGHALVEDLPTGRTVRRRRRRRRRKWLRKVE